MLGLQLSLTLFQGSQSSHWLSFPSLCRVCPCGCLSRIKTGCVTLGQLLTLSGYRESEWGGGEVCWKPSPGGGGGTRPSSLNTQGSRTTNLPLLGSGNAENFLVFIWFSFKCFQRQPSCSTTVPRKLVHVGRSLPENEVICSFFIFCCLSPSARVNRPLQSLPAYTRPAAGVGRAGGGRGEGQDPRGAASAPGAPSPPPPPAPTRDFPGPARKVSSREAARAPPRPARQTITVNNAPLST